jgi:hypothetical protein
MSTAEHSSPDPAQNRRSRAVGRRLTRQTGTGYLLASLTARARPGSVEASRWWLVNRLPTGVVGVAG